MNGSFFNRSAAGSAKVRPSPIAGQWYPGMPDRLRASVQSYLDAAGVEPLDGRVVALVAPHAGYTYSGGVAGCAYRLVEGKRYDVVTIVAPNHRIMQHAPYLVADYASYWTPLGEVPLAEDLVAKLDARLGVSRVQRDEEHSLEIQLPFLQVALDGEFQLLPVMLGDRSDETCRALGEALADVLQDRNALLVASTDLSHFYNEEAANRLDGAVTDRIAAFDPEGLLEVLATGKGEACGGGPTVAVMLAARELGANRGKMLKYATSGDVTGDYARVVGYAAAALYDAGA
jgi:AmmeMemoRadiSam system protein B